MTKYERDADRKLDNGDITLGEYEQMIEPLKREIQPEPCEDVISRQAAISAVGYCQTYLFDSRDKDKKISLENAEYAIEQLPSTQPEQRWIPCSERSPEEKRYVLITKESFKINGYEQEVIKAKRSADPRSGKIEWWSPEFGTLKNKAVLAWMPLPEPYKEEKK